LLFTMRGCERCFFATSEKDARQGVGATACRDRNDEFDRLVRVVSGKGRPGHRQRSQAPSLDEPPAAEGVSMHRLVLCHAVPVSGE
jgi:hypothetical protein